MSKFLHRSLLCLALASPLFAQGQTSEAKPAEEAAETAAAATEQPAAEAAAETSAESASPASNGLIAPPPEGKGQIVFFREKKFTGAAVNYKVREGETELGKLSNGTYFVHVTEPGAHEYTVHSEAKDILNLEVEAGETYYVSGGITMGLLAGRPNLSPSDEAAFESLSSKLKPAKPLK